MTSRSGPAREPVHVPVMIQEVVELLNPRPGGVFIDATLGGGGHAATLLERVGPEGRLLGIDRDAETLEETRRQLGEDPRLLTAHGDYRDLPSLMEAAGMDRVDGLLADLGISSLQLEGAGRGFSFSRDEPLDMRMDRSQGRTASEWLVAQDEASLVKVLREFGEERRFARRIARALLRRQRDEGPFRTTGALAAVVRSAVTVRGPQRIDPATRTFQAIRIAVNEELLGLDRFVEDAVNALRIGGRLVIISFHSLEDRQVKHALRELEGRCICPPDLPVCGCEPVEKIRLLTRRPRRPGPEEVEGNPRSRSARLRAAERLDTGEAAA